MNPRTGALRAGLIGVGSMGRHHARVLGHLDGVELVGAVDPAGDVAGAVRAPVFPTLSELLELGIDYAVVACPTAFHEEIGLQLAEHRVCTLIEKPLAPTVDAARRLVAAFEAAGVVAGVGHIERYNPALQSMRLRLEAGELGEVFQVATRRQGPIPLRIGDVGVVMDLATHDIDLTSWVADQEYHSVSAHTAFRSGRRHEDMVAAVGRLSDGTMANHLVNWMSPFKERFTIVTGDRGCFVADTLSADLTFYANGATGPEWEVLRAFRGMTEGDVTRYAIPKREPLLVEHERFRDAVEGKENDIVTLRQGLRTVEIAEAVLRSAATGLTMDCAPTPASAADGPHD